MRRLDPAIFFFNQATTEWFRRSIQVSPTLPSGFIGLVSGLLIGGATCFVVPSLRRQRE